jgi:hypothetical protein
MFAVRVAAMPSPGSQRAKEGTGTRCRAAYKMTMLEAYTRPPIVAGSITAKSKQPPSGSPACGGPTATMPTRRRAARSPIQGSLQLIFCDIGTPGDDWNVYDELRDQLDTSALVI